MSVIDFQGSLPAQVLQVGTGGILTPQEVPFWRDTFFQTAPPAVPNTFVVDLSLAVPLASALEDFLVPLARKVMSGYYGPAKLVVCSPDAGVRHAISGLALLHGIGVYVCDSIHALHAAQPVGMTPTEQNSFELIQKIGGAVSASVFAAKAGLEPSAASNRLVNLEKRGFVHRVRRSGREGDLFVDPRMASVPDWYAGADAIEEIAYAP